MFNKVCENEEIKSLNQEISYINVSKDNSRDSYEVVHAVDNITIYGVDKNNKWGSLTKRMLSFGMYDVGKEAVAVFPGKHTFYVAYNNIVTPSANMKLTFDVKKDHDYSIRSCITDHSSRSISD